MTTCPTCGAGTTACTSRTLTSGRHCCNTCTDHRHPTATASAAQEPRKIRAKGTQTRGLPELPARHCLGVVFRAEVP